MLLALDTSTRMIGIALYDGIHVFSETSWQSQYHHTVELAPAVAEALTRAGCASSDIKAVGVAIGPGSFTGLRIGLALAKGLAMSQGIPIIGVPTLDILAAPQHIDESTSLIAVIQAGRKRLVVGWYEVEADEWKSTGVLENLIPEELLSRILKPTLVCGELTKEVQLMLRQQCNNAILASPAHSVRRPSVLAEIAWKRWQAGQTDDPRTLTPIYLHHGLPIPK